MPFTKDDYEEILRTFEALSDEKYKKFNESLIPGTLTAYGVRVPDVRAVAKKVIRRDAEAFLRNTAPASYEETMLRGLVIAGMKADLETRLAHVRQFLPLIDNWAVCDSFCSTFRLRPEETQPMWEFLRPLFADSREYFARFAAVMQLGHFVTEAYIDEGLRLLASMRQELYYVQMAAAWAISVCYVKFRDKTLELLKRRELPKFVQNRSIQKIRESYRVEQADKEMLARYKI